MMWPRWYKPPTPRFFARFIVEEVARSFSMTLDELRAPCRKRERVVARSVAARILRDCQRGGAPRYSLPQIARLIGRSDHTTVIHALEQFPIWVKHYPGADETYERLRTLAA